MKTLIFTDQKQIFADTIGQARDYTDYMHYRGKIFADCKRISTDKNIIGSIRGNQLVIRVNHLEEVIKQ